MIKFFKVYQWQDFPDIPVKQIDLLKICTVSCKCGCGEISLYLVVLGVGIVITKYVNIKK